MEQLTGEAFPSLIVGAMAIGLSSVYLLVGRPSRTTMWLALAVASTGAAVVFAGAIVDNVPDHDIPLWMRLYGITTFLQLWSAAMYMRALSDTNPVPGRARTIVRLTLPAGLILGTWAIITGAADPTAFANDHALALFESEHADGWWAYVAFGIALGGVYSTGWIALAFQGVDAAERDRALLTGASVPLLASALFLPYKWSVACAALAFLLPLAGVLRYMTIDGARGVFLARFLSPEVIEVVRTGGIQGVTKSQSLELSAVYCDLRGFTAYAEAVPSHAVIELLAQYYDAIGKAAADAHATVKDYSGDGVLMLVGAPIPRSDHAPAAMALAHAALLACREVLDNWSTTHHQLGLGIGVASGKVTVGAIGSVDRMEYTAVGVPVNLAARLCAVAAAGEILVDKQTADLAPRDGLAPREPIALKGLSEPQQVYAVTSATEKDAS